MLSHDGLQNVVPCAELQKEETAPRPICVKCFQLRHGPENESLRCEHVDGRGLGIVCCLAGQINMQLSDGVDITEHAILAGRMGCYACPCGWCRAECASAKSARGLRLRFSRATLNTLMGDSAAFIRGVTPFSDSRHVNVVRDITPQMNSVIASLQDTLQGKRQNGLLVTAKALELLHLHFSAARQAGPPVIDPDDEKAIHKARRLLCRRLDDPPALDDLAHAIGMSLSKFKICFAKVFGMPPYTYLRKARMQQAMALLRRNGVNVTEAAMTVGYSSISHFSKAFYQEYAVHPSEIRRKKGP